MAKKIPLEKLNLLAMFDMVNDLSKSSKKNVVSEYNLFNFTTETQKKNFFNICRTVRKHNVSDLTDKDKEKILLYVRKANTVKKYWSCVVAKEYMERRNVYEQQTSTSFYE